MNTENADTTAPKQQIGRPFPKGVSGNPDGRPVGSKNFSTLFEDAIKIIVKEQRIPVKNPEVEMVVKAVSQALKGNYVFYRDIMDRNYGSTNRSSDTNIAVAVQNITYSPEDTKAGFMFLAKQYPEWLEEISTQTKSQE